MEGPGSQRISAGLVVTDVASPSPERFATGAETGANGDEVASAALVRKGAAAARQAAKGNAARIRLRRRGFFFGFKLVFQLLQRVRPDYPG